MKLLTEREQVRSVLARHKFAYPDRNFVYFDGTTAGQMQDALAKLDTETATAADVAAVVGNGSWCEPKECDECGESSWNVVEVGEEPDYESSTANLCYGCVCKALALLSP